MPQYGNVGASMDKERLKVMVKDLKNQISMLESEIYSDVNAYTPSTHLPNNYRDAYDDDGYAD